MIAQLLADVSSTGGDGIETVGAAGQLMAAVLQTAGLYAQGEVMTFFRGALTSVAVFVYMISITMAVTSVVVYGSYQKAFYFLIGPALFTFILTEQVPGAYTALKYGSRTTPYTQQDQLAFLRSVSTAYGGTPSVSWFFKVYDGVVSSVVQGTVSMLIDTQNKQDLIANARERVFSRAFMGEAIDPGFKKLISKILLGHCSEATGLSMELAQPRYRNAITNTPEEAQRLEKQTRLQKLLENSDGSPVRSISLDPDEVEFAAMYGYDRTELEQQGIGCLTAWDLVKQASFRAAEAQLNEYSSEEAFVPGPSADAIPWHEIREQVTKAIHPHDPTKAIAVLAAFVLKNSLGETAHSAMTAQLSNRAPMIANKYNGVFGDYANAMAQGGYMRIVYFAGTIPYIQGVLLFLLAASFPFFAVFLVMPERMTAFFVWMTLWLWVKSWDIGFALIDVIRELLFPYLAHDVNIAETIPDWNQPGAIFNIIYQNDPLANYNTYLMIVSLLRLAVPALTAHLCMGATGLYDAFKSSIDKNANRFANLRRNYSRRMLATGYQLQAEAINAGAKREAMLEAAANPGETADGVSRFVSGGGAVARYMHGQGNIAGLDSYHSPQEQHARQARGATEGRRMAYDFTRGKDAFLAHRNEMNESLNVSWPWEQSTVPGIGSDKFNDSGMGLPDIGKSGSQSEVDEGGGGEGG